MTTSSAEVNLREAERLVALAESQERYHDADSNRRMLLIPALYALLRDEPEEVSIRRALWLGHSHTTQLYGDDGEMQCHACLPVWDYRRAPLADVVQAALAALAGPRADPQR